ncbi:hypothetical protein PPSIR1_13150 [Plesiocystis pacifica SIR-1]|uniref:Uncharacterized protein n=1 Tax=Plesiocystis pacifica SIR-1 TaxID=391625 RepID=A6GAX7_9BACT|nr:hypothetical protein PPSIR1_13150 [Plesiocystis pacifica SIR-1]
MRGVAEVGPGWEVRLWPLAARMLGRVRRASTVNGGTAWVKRSTTRSGAIMASRLCDML